MHFSWLMHLLIFLLFSRFSSGVAFSAYDDSEEKELTSEPLLFQDLSEELDDYNGKKKIRKTTTSMMKTTKHHLISNNDDVHYYHNHEDETEDEEISLTTFITTTSSSSSTRIGSTTDAITETTTTTSEIAVTHSIGISDTMLHDIDEHTAFMITIDPEQIAKFLAKTNRDRLFLKIFTITVIVGMFTLAIVLLTIHMVRTKRYRGYRTPANTSTNDRSKYPNTIKV